MKGNLNVFAVNGSARKDGNTAILIKYVLNELEKEGIKTEFVQLSDLKLEGCKACYKCFENKDGRCSRKKDDMNFLIDKMAESDGIILGSPTYFGNVSSEMKALIDRAGLVGRANDDMFKQKVGAAVVVARRAGFIHAFNSINHFFLFSQMVVPGSSYWNLGVGLKKGDVEKDEEGIRTMKVLGKNMAWVLKKLQD